MKPIIQFTINQKIICEGSLNCNKLARFQITNKKEIDSKTNLIINHCIAYCPEHSPIKYSIDELKQKEKEFKSKYMKRQYLYVFNCCNENELLETGKLSESEYKALKEAAIKDLELFERLKELN